MHEGLRYTAKVDVWSLGTILFELATGQVLMNEAEYSQMRHNHTQPKPPYELALALVLLYECSTHCPQPQPSAPAYLYAQAARIPELFHLRRPRALSREFRRLLENMLVPTPRNRFDIGIAVLSPPHTVSYRLYPSWDATARLCV